MSSQFGLLRERRFGPLFWVQFLNAFNDNVFKNALLILIAYRGASLGGLAPEVLVNIAAGVFILPFFLLSALGGEIADKFPKDALVRALKLAEIGIAALACIGMLRGDVGLLLAVLLLLGVQATLFGPVKYAILPQVLDARELVGGNAMIEMGTFVAILVGTLLGGLLIGRGDEGRALVAATVVAAALAGYATSRRIPPIAPLDPALRLGIDPIAATWRTLRAAHAEPSVFNAIVGISWFWFFGAIFVTQLPSYTKLILAGDEMVGTLLLATFSLGIGLGSLACERLSGKRVEIGLVPFGSIGLSLFAADLYFAVPWAVESGSLLAGVGAFLASPHGWRVLADILAISLFGGLFVIPLYALVQLRSAPAWRSRIIAANNVMNALAMVIAAVAGALMLGPAKLNVAQVFMVAAVMNVVVAVYIYRMVPEFLVRFLAWLLLHTMYRVERADLDAIPEQGAAVVVSNHVSFVDAIVIMGACRRPMRFVMYHTIFRLPVLNWIFRQVRAIPIAPAREDAALLERAYEEIAAALAAGELVCIFPEGGLTPDGEIHDFKPGIERIVARSPVPVVPLALRGLWGSMFSRRGGPAFAKLPRGWRSRIELVAGDAVAAAEVDAGGLRERVRQLRGSRA